MFAETALQCFQSSYLHSQRRVHYFSHNPRKHITIDKTLKSAPTPYNCDICQRMNRLEEVRILPLTSLLPSDVQVQPTVTRSETRGCACVHYLKREAREERNMVSRFGLAVKRGKQRTSVRIRFGSLFSSKVVVCGYCLVTLSLTINETLKWLSSLPTLMQKSFWW